MNIGRFILLLAFIIFLIGGMNLYAASRIFQSIAFLFPKINRFRFIYAGIYIFIAFSFIVGKWPSRLPPVIKGIFSWTGAHWTGLLIYLCLFFIMADIIVLIGNALKLTPAHMLLHVRFYARMAAIALSMAVAAYGLYNASRIIVVSYDVQLKKSLSGEMNIVLVSDLHLGDVNSESSLERITRGINSLNPDIVCIVGDIFNDDFYTIRNPDRASALLKSINAPYGVYASLGNHDGGLTLNEMMDFLERSGVKILKDEHTIIDERLVLIGRLDPSPIGGFGEMSRRDFSELLAQIDSNLPLVVMDHNPASIDQYGAEVDLILAGHTHGGQLFPGNLFTRSMFTVDYGHYQKDPGSPHVIVTQGAGTLMMPMRIGTNNEIASVRVR